MSNYAAKSDLQNKCWNVHLKSNIDKTNISKLESTHAHLSKLHNVVENDVIKKTVYDELVEKVSAVKILDTNDLVEKADYNPKNDEIQKKKLIMVNILPLKNLVS